MPKYIPIVEARQIAILSLLPVPISIVYQEGEELYRWEIVSLKRDGTAQTFEEACYEALTVALTPQEDRQGVAILRPPQIPYDLGK